jgi:hypothetical protein
MDDVSSILVGLAGLAALATCCWPTIRGMHTGSACRVAGARIRFATDGCGTGTEARRGLPGRRAQARCFFSANGRGDGSRDSGGTDVVGAALAWAAS